MTHNYNLTSVRGDFRCAIVEIPQRDSLEIDSESDLDVARALDKYSTK
jgi:hypothetical protein